jgi:hypothetical protein
MPPKSQLANAPLRDPSDTKDRKLGHVERPKPETPNPPIVDHLRPENRSAADLSIAYTMNLFGRGCTLFLGAVSGALVLAGRLLGLRGAIG